MTDIPIINDITALGILTMVLILGYYFIQKIMKILTEHLERMVRRQDETIELLRECLSIKESFSDNIHKNRINDT